MFGNTKCWKMLLCFFPAWRFQTCFWDIGTFCSWKVSPPSNPNPLLSILFQLYSLGFLIWTPKSLLHLIPHHKIIYNLWLHDELFPFQERVRIDIKYRSDERQGKILSVIFSRNVSNSSEKKNGLEVRARTGRFRMITLVTITMPPI